MNHRVLYGHIGGYLITYAGLSIPFGLNAFVWPFAAWAPVVCLTISGTIIGLLRRAFKCKIAHFINGEIEKGSN